MDPEAMIAKGMQKAEKASQPSKPKTETRSWSDADDKGIRRSLLTVERHPLPLSRLPRLAPQHAVYPH